MKILKYLSLPTLFFIIACQSCNMEPEQKEYDKNMLYGRWEIASAERDGKPTETLDSTYFVFDQTGKLTSNFNIDGLEESGDFEFADNTIREKKTNGLSFAVDTLATDQMVLMTQFMDFEFKLTLEKK